ncbi:MAG: HutD family protein [Antricoccus sp.]
MKQLSAADYTVMPWKNGGGTTMEIARDVANEGYRWRLSIADIRADGPFSTFPGRSRIISVLEGTGMRLTIDGTPTDRLYRYEPFKFAGAAITSCALLDGPVRDFNLIFDPERYRARVSWHCAPLDIPGDQHIVLSAHDGCVVNDQSLALYDTVFCDDPLFIRPSNGQSFAIVTLNRITH